MDITQLQKDSYRIAEEHGFYDGYPEDRSDPRANATRLMLIVSELSEALEDVRNGHLKLTAINGKPEGLPSELADAVIRIADYAEWQGFNLAQAIEIKQTYNEARPYKHGGKAI